MFQVSIVQTLFSISDMTSYLNFGASIMWEWNYTESENKDYIFISKVRFSATVKSNLIPHFFNNMCQWCTWISKIFLCVIIVC